LRRGRKGRGKVPDHLFVTYGLSDDGDLPTIVWKHLPSDAEVKAAYLELLPVEAGFMDWHRCLAEVRE
jgi:hypothetical protein